MKIDPHHGVLRGKAKDKCVKSDPISERMKIVISFNVFRELFERKKPIIQGGMGPSDTTNLAIAVSKAGAIGLISTVGLGSFHMPGIGFTARC